MEFYFGKKSMESIEGANGRPPMHPDLVRVIKRALSYNIVDFRVDCGGRSEQDQIDLYAQGRTKPGLIVTWTLNSLHKKQKDGYAHAGDLIPLPVDWNNENPFWLLRGIILAAAKEEGVEVEYLPGGRDLPHVQLARKYRL